MKKLFCIVLLHFIHLAVVCMLVLLTCNTTVAQTISREHEFTDWQLPLSKSAYIPDSTRVQLLTYFNSAGYQGPEAGLDFYLIPIGEIYFRAGLNVVPVGLSESFFGLSYGVQGEIYETETGQVSIGGMRKYLSYETRPNKLIPNDFATTESLTMTELFLTYSYSVWQNIYGHISAGYIHYTRDQVRNIVHFTVAASHVMPLNSRLGLEYRLYLPEFEYLANVIAVSVAWQPLFFYLEAGYMKYFNGSFETPDGYLLRGGFVF